MDEQSLFAAALLLPPDQRAAYLDEVCAGDRPLRQRLERLLSADGHGLGILDRCTVVAPGTHRAVPLAPGQMFADHYRLTQKLGEGGMGEVWAADQTAPVLRPVALKFLHARYDPRGAAAARFLAEARITARLQHPGIPPVHHVDEAPSGRPFLVMKLIAGRTLDRLLAEQGTGSARWLGVFESICQAVGYAHAQGVLHRDLKPSNVMVGAFGEVLVMDWGLAKVLAQAPDATPDEIPDPSVPPVGGTTEALTRTGLAMGTPAYMAPEQAAGQWDAVDSRSDVFGLGAILCALLTGRPPEPVTLTPAPTGAAEKTFARLAESAAPPELIALCKRCLAADPADRPADGAAVAAAVAELRRGAEERARQAELERARAEVHAAEQRKRRRLTLLGAGALAAALLIGVVGTTIGLVRAEGARANEAAQRAAAEAARDRVRDVLDTMTSQIVEDVLATQSALSAEQKVFLTRVLADYRTFAREGAEDELARRRVAAAAFRVGKIEDRLGRREGAVAAFRQALQTYELLATEAPTVSGYQESLADCHNNLGIELSDLGHTGEAEVHYREALSIRERLAASQPDVAEHRRSLGVSHYNLGNMLRDSGRKPKARGHLQRAVDLREKLAADPPHSTDSDREWAAALTALGNVFTDLGERAEAERLYAKAVPVLEQLTGAAPMVAEYRRELASALNGQGNLLMGRKDWAPAREHLHRALALRERLAADSPGAAEALRELAMTLSNLAQLYVHTGDRKAAEDHFRRALTHFEKLAADHPNTQSYQVELGNTYFGFGVFVYTGGGAAECLSWFDKAAQRLAAVHEKDPAHALATRQLCNSYRARAIAFDRLERWGDAVSAWDRALDLGAPEVRTQILAGRAVALLHAGEIARAVADVEALQGTGGWNAEQLYNFACVCSVAAKTLERKQERADRAMELLRKAVAAGWDDVALTKQDTDLDPLRARADFKKLLAELEAKYPQKK